MSLKIIVISGHIGFEVTVEDIRKQLNAAKGADILAEISSPGGFVHVGIEIFNLFRDYPGHTTAKIMGVAASMASYIPLAFDKIIAHDNTIFMIHNALTIAIGNHNEMRKTADHLEGISNLLANAYIQKNGMTLAEIKEKMDNETFYYGREMLDAGFVDEIIESPENDKKKDKASAIIESKLMVQAVFARMKESAEAEADLQQAVAYLSKSQGSSENDNKISEADQVWLPLDSHGLIIYDQLSSLYDNAEAFDPEAPFPNEHACRIRDPKNFKQDSFRRIKSSGEGKKFNIIIGKLKGKTTTTTQAFRYSKDVWSESESKKHCKDHDGILFEPATGSGNDINNCAHCGKQQKEEHKMDLKKLLAENPEAQADFDTAITASKKAGVESVQAIIKKVVPIMLSDDHANAVKVLGGKVLNGEESISSFTAVVTIEDARIEKEKADAAVKETGSQEETTGGGGGASAEDGSINNPDDFAAAEAEHKADKK